jgi:hypothetical protein
MPPQACRTVNAAAHRAFFFGLIVTPKTCHAGCVHWPRFRKSRSHGPTSFHPPGGGPPFFAGGGGPDGR